MNRSWRGMVICGFALVLAYAVHADEDADTKAVLEKAVKAMGGDAKLGKLKTASAKGKVTAQFGGQEFALTFDGLWRGLEHYRIDIDVTVNGQNMKALLIINADKAWVKHQDRIDDAPAEVPTIAKNSLHAMRLPQLLGELKAPTYKLSHTGEIKIGDRSAVGLLVTRKDFQDVSLYFDKENGLPIKSEVRVTDPQGKEINIEYLYDDYKDLGGVKHPGKVTIKADGMELSLQLDQVNAEDKVEDNSFARPE